ncbi:MAG: XdhC/CoxI family protein [Bacteroidetes bacterium]|nr:XdhC/CoxI family protein [Bacteroidota bacterium]
MKEIREIIRSYDELQNEGKRSALATVVHVEGSSYRRPGARMLVVEDGRLTGAISGGCLEGDAMRKAFHVINEQRPALVTYDTMDEDDATLGIGLGCNGIIQVLIEPILPDDPLNPISLLKKATEHRQTSVIATLFNLSDRRQAQPGTQLFLGENGEVLGECPIESLEGRWQEDARSAFHSNENKWVSYSTPQGEVTAFYEILPPVLSLVLIGAGNDVMPVVDMADILGWETKVVDGRATHARPERFASACQVLVAKPEQVLKHIAIDDYTVFALMTHNYNYDKAMLHELCQQGARYIAMLGPKKKLNRILEEFEEEDRPLSATQLESIFSPAGLDIGAETSEEIALSILAEIMAFLKERRGIFLRDKLLPIHEREKLVIN